MEVAVFDNAPHVAEIYGAALRAPSRQMRGGATKVMLIHPGGTLCRAQIVETLGPVWVAYYRLAEVRGNFEILDQWLRRKLPSIRWRR